MTMMQSELYFALLSAGAPEDKARAAAIAAADRKFRFERDPRDYAPSKVGPTKRTYNRWAEPLLPIAIVGGALIITYFFGRC